LAASASRGPPCRADQDGARFANGVCCRQRPQIIVGGLKIFATSHLSGAAARVPGIRRGGV